MIKENGPVSISQAFDAIRADYNMSRESRFVRRRVGLPAQGNSADWHYRVEQKYYSDIEKARDMDRNDAVIGTTIDRAVSNIVQDGFTLDVRTGDKRLDADLTAMWKAWAEDPDQCDIAGEDCFCEYERLSCRAMLASGDCVNTGTLGGSLQHFEAHNIQTSTKQKNTFLGVTKTPFGRHEQYWVMADAIEPNRTKEQAKPLSVRDDNGLRTLFHVYNKKRMSQTRGVTALAPIFELSGMFEDIQFAKLVQQQVVSCFAIFRKRGEPAVSGGESGYGDQDTEVTDTGTRIIENIAPGMEILGEPGEELEGFSPNVPNAEFFQHVHLMLQMIGVNLGLPLVLVLMDGSETNFSGWRGAVDEARKGFRSNQRNLKDRFHSPVYRWKVAQWLAKDATLRNAAKRTKVNITGHKWNAPTWAYIEPVKDAQGDALRLQNGLISPRRLHAERGRDWEEVSAEIIDDQQKAILTAKKAAAAINKKYPDDAKVTWRELIALPMPQGIQGTLPDPNTDQDNGDDSDA